MASPWTRLRARLNRVVQPHFYTAYRIESNERVGRVDRPVDAVRAFLRERGYEPQRLSAAKARPGAEEPFVGEDLHALSYRRVPTDHPDRWPLDEWRPRQCQYHVHAFARPEGVVLYSHYKLRPWPLPIAGEDLPTALRRARTHYRPVRGREYVPGVTDLDV
jgi:hypothetical protein